MKPAILFWLSIIISRVVTEAAMLNWTPQGTFSFKLLSTTKVGNL